ncbi:hypothetical protein JYB87_12385 [Shewanella avicenniae]|uniref:Uncharacterized protein n=1 Tax=Shewanella avicenniae TaxID=2814294 RepID=A0ABX7QPA2_9GAMM|nr:hypothetical protein [Shewanella avicenniae]QSX32558.1 hypothetical protein JYB87_12385 [Shewanella avicenniae]
MKTITLNYPQEAPICMETLLDYISTWHFGRSVKQDGQLKITLDDEIVQSELMILREHFPWLSVLVVN